MRVRGEGWFFDAAYIFLGEKEVYVTDALYIILKSATYRV
jgi:hypothetical protein